MKLPETAAELRAMCALPICPDYDDVALTRFLALDPAEALRSIPPRDAAYVIAGLLPRDRLATWSRAIAERARGYAIDATRTASAATDAVAAADAATDATDAIDAESDAAYYARTAATDGSDARAAAADAIDAADAACAAATDAAAAAARIVAAAAERRLSIEHGIKLLLEG